MIKYYVVTIIGIGVFLLGGYLLFQWGQSIRLEERLKQEKANAEFRVRVNKGAVDFDTCDRAGGLYQFESGTCKLPGT